jgi:hypothetical protein
MDTTVSFKAPAELLSMKRLLTNCLFNCTINRNVNVIGVALIVEASSSCQPQLPPLRVTFPIER